MVRLNKEMCVKGSAIVFVPRGPQMFVSESSLPDSAVDKLYRCFSRAYGTRVTDFALHCPVWPREERTVWGECCHTETFLAFKFELKAFMQLLINLWFLDQGFHFSFYFSLLPATPNLEILGMFWLSLHLSNWWKKEHGTRRTFSILALLNVNVPKINVLLKLNAMN